MVGRIRCNECRAEGMGDGDSILYCQGCYGGLKTALAEKQLVLKECDEYLEGHYKMNSIGRGSVLHNKIKQTMEDYPKLTDSLAPLRAKLEKWRTKRLVTRDELVSKIQKWADRRDDVNIFSENTVILRQAATVIQEYDQFSSEAWTTVCKAVGK